MGFFILKRFQYSLKWTFFGYIKFGGLVLIENNKNPGWLTFKPKFAAVPKGKWWRVQSCFTR